MIQKKKHRRIDYTYLGSNKMKCDVNFPDTLYATASKARFNLYTTDEFYFYTEEVKLFYTAYNEKTGCYCPTAKLCPYPEDFRFKL